MLDYNKVEFLVINSQISEKWCSSGLEMVQIQCNSEIQF